MAPKWPKSTKPETIIEEVNLKAQRIGAYGGTFDPVHLGHIEIARAVLKNFALDQLLVIPAYKPPHKTLAAISNSLQRYRMCVLAFAGEARIRVSKMEIELPERPYTITTIERLRAEYGSQAKLFFVMGADSFAEITTWRDYEKLLASTNVIVASRPGVEISSAHLPAEFRARVVDARGETATAPLIKDDEKCFIYLTDYVDCDVSSTQIRRRARQGHSLEGLTAPRVIDYIEEHHLYQEEQAKT